MRLAKKIAESCGHQKTPQAVLLPLIKKPGWNHIKHEYPCNHDHDYMDTQRAGWLPSTLDSLIVTHPEFEDFMQDYRQAKRVEEIHKVMEEKGQISSLDLVKDNCLLFAYYTGLPSYDTFKPVFHQGWKLTKMATVIRLQGIYHQVSNCSFPHLKTKSLFSSLQNSWSILIKSLLLVFT